MRPDRRLPVFVLPCRICPWPFPDTLVSRYHLVSSGFVLFDLIWLNAVQEPVRLDVEVIGLET
ncbi:hypothetical protein ES702_00528 [subsurface metagenome]